MNLLIDTHILIWLISKDKKMGSRTAELIRSSAENVYVSYFSFLEIAVKAGSGKLDFDSSVINDLPSMGIELIMPDVDTLIDYKIYNAQNKDPFDNILITTAINHRLQFVTSDKKILAVSRRGLKVLDATK